MGKKRKNDDEDILTRDNTNKSINISDQSGLKENLDDKSKLKRVNSDSKLNEKVKIISNEKISNFSDYLKVANLTSKKDILMKGLADISLNTKFNLKPIINETPKVKDSSSSEDEDVTREKSNNNTLRSNDKDELKSVNSPKKRKDKKRKKEKVSETESSSEDDTNTTLPITARKSAALEDGFNGVNIKQKFKSKETVSDSSSDSGSDNENKKIKKSNDLQCIKFQSEGIAKLNRNDQKSKETLRSNDKDELTSVDSPKKRNDKRQKKEKVSETESSSEDNANTTLPIITRKSVTFKDDFNGVDVKQKNKSKETISDSSSDSSSDEKASDNENKKIKKLNDLRYNKLDKLKRNGQKSKLIDNYKVDNKLKSIYDKINVNLDEIKEDWEICLVQLPKTMNPQLLLDKTINFDEDTKIKGEEHSKFVLSVENKFKQDPIMLMSNTSDNHCSVKLLNSTGFIKAQQVLKSKKIRDLDEKVEYKVPYPTNLKIRHPIFGPDYKNKIKLDEHIEKKLDDAIKESNKKLKKKKKRSMSESKVDENKDNELLFAMFNEHKMKKSKPEVEDNLDSALSRKKKKKKSKIEDTEKTLVDASSSFNESTFKLNHSLITNSSDEFEAKPLKKHKKKKSLEQNSLIEKSIFDETTDEMISSPEKKHKIIASSTMINNLAPNFDIDLSQININDSVKKKKKKHKVKEDDLTNEILNQIEMDIKKKHKQEDDSDNDVAERQKFKKKKRKH